jgi:hypothetical protein
MLGRDPDYNHDEQALERHYTLLKNDKSDTLHEKQLLRSKLFAQKSNNLSLPLAIASASNALFFSISALTFPSSSTELTPARDI